MEDFGYLGVGSNVRQVLEGSFKTPPGTDPHMQKLLQLLKMDEPIQMADPISTVVMMDEYITRWGKAHEVTSLGPPGYHFGHAKAVCKDRLLANIKDTMTNIPCASGNLPQRW